ncbi:Ig-like domain-containing protein, partial [Chryseosolibacter indicus]
NDSKTTNEDVATTLNVTTNDTDVDGTIDAASVDLDPSTSGTQTTYSSNGSWSVDNTGLVTYTPAADFHGTASITYTVKDNSGT